MLLTWCVNQSENCLHLCIIIYIEIHVPTTYGNLALKMIIHNIYYFFFLRPLHETHIILYLSRPFSCPIIRMFPVLQVLGHVTHKRHTFQTQHMNNSNSAAEYKKNMCSKRKILTNLSKQAVVSWIWPRCMWYKWFWGVAYTRWPTRGVVVLLPT